MRVYLTVCPRPVVSVPSRLGCGKPIHHCRLHVAAAKGGGLHYVLVEVVLEEGGARGAAVAIVDSKEGVPRWLPVRPAAVKVRQRCVYFLWPGEVAGSR